MADTVIGIYANKLNIVRNLDTINLSWIENKVPSKPQINNFILIEEELERSADAEFEEIFSKIWQKNVLNALIIYWNQSVNAVTFTPFPKMQLQYIASDDLLNMDILFYDKSRNLYGHPFRITAFYDISRAVFDRTQPNKMQALKGVDGLLGQMIVLKMNATLNMSEPADNMQIGELFPNQTATGCLGSLMSGNYDFGLNMRFYRLEHFEGKVEATLSIGRDDICFLVPRKGKLIDIGNLFRPFNLETWILIGVFLPCYVLIFYALTGTKQTEPIYRRSFQYYFLYFYGSILQQSFPFIPQIRRQRILIANWMIGVLLLSFMYQSTLSGSAIIPKDSPDIDNMEELARSDLKIASFARYNRQITQFFSDPVYRGIYNPLLNKLIDCSIGDFNDLIKSFDRSYGFANKFHINMYLRRMYTKDSNVFYHQVKQCPVPYLGVYGIQYGTPYKKHINFIIRQAQEGGIIEEWERANQISEQKMMGSGDGGLVRFSLVHLQTAFYLLFLGLTISILAFFGEKIFYRYTVKRSHAKLRA